MDEKAVQVLESGAFPVRGIEDAIAIHDRFVELKQRLIVKVDGLDQISGRPYVNKQGWLSTSTAFEVNVSIVDSDVREIPGTDSTRPACRQAWVRMRAWKGGRSFEAEGTCDTSEDWSRRGNFAPPGADGAAMLYRRRGDDWETSWHYPKTWNALSSFAQTRGCNRAIAGLLGLSEISAEEAIGVEDTGEDQDAESRRKAGARSIGKRPQASRPTTVTGETPPRDPVGEVFKIADKLVPLVGSEENKKAWGRSLKAAGIALGTSLYKSTKLDPKTTVATKEEQLAFWRLYRAELIAAEERVAGIAAKGEERETPEEEKGVAE